MVALGFGAHLTREGDVSLVVSGREGELFCVLVDSEVEHDLRFYEKDIEHWASRQRHESSGSRILAGPNVQIPSSFIELDACEDGLRHFYAMDSSCSGPRDLRPSAMGVLRNRHFMIASYVFRFALILVGFLCHVGERAVAEEVGAAQLREVIVSYAQGTNKLQLYRVTGDGTSRREITDGKSDCMMPAWSPNGKKVVYVRQSTEGLDLWLCDPDGMNHVQLTKTGRNRIPSWLPDSKHVVWMVSKPGNGTQDPAANSQLYIMNTDTMESRRLFSDAQQIRYSNSMPVVSPLGRKVAFVSNRSGSYRVWISNLDGSDAKPISPVPVEKDETLGLPIEQKVPAWSPDGKWIAHWEGVEMTHMSRFTGRQDRERDRLIAATFHVWVVGSDGNGKRKAGRGDDPNWSPDGLVTRSFPDPRRGGANVMIEGANHWRELPILPKGTTRYGRFTWKSL